MFPLPILFGCQAANIRRENKYNFYDIMHEFLFFLTREAVKVSANLFFSYNLREF